MALLLLLISSQVQANLATLEAAQERRHQLFASGKSTAVDEVERAAVVALGEQAAGDDANIEKVIVLLIHSLDAEPTVRRSAIFALEKIGVRAVPHLISALNQRTDETIRGGAAEALGELRSPEVVPVLAACLHDDDRWVRNRCGYALACAAELLPAARSPLLDSLSDDDVADGVRDFMHTWPGELERLAPELPAALEARVSQVSHWGFRGALAASLVSFLVFVFGMIRLMLSGKGRVSAADTGLRVTWSHRDSMNVSDLVEGLRARNAAAINFGQRALGLLGFVAFAFLAIGFGLVDAGESAGWVFVAFVGLLFGVLVQQTALSYSKRRTRQ